MEEGKNKFVVVGIGEVLWDIYRQGRHLGGAASNFAIHATQLGDHGLMVSRVGDDGMGRELLMALKNWQLQTRYIQTDPLHGTGNVMISLDVKGVPAFRCSHDVAFDYLQHDEKNQALAASADAVFFTALGQRAAGSRYAVQRFLHSANRAVKIFDVNWLPPRDELRALLKQCLSFTQILKANELGMNAVRHALRKEAESMSKFVDYLFKKYSIKLVVMTRGESGCEIYDGRRMVKVDALPVRAVDTTGAGDAFAAGLIHKYLRGAPLQDMAEFANLLGAFVSTQFGATPAFSPTLLETFTENLA